MQIREILGLFIIYSFFGWILECSIHAFKKKKFVNRGVLGGPFCCLYGVFFTLAYLFLGGLLKHPVFMYIGCSILFAVVEFLTAKYLELLYNRRWWDYSKSRFNIDGIISLHSALAGGFIGFLGMFWLNEEFLHLIRLIPPVVQTVLIIVILTIMIIDAARTYCYVKGLPVRHDPTEPVHNQLVRFSNWLSRVTIKRVGSLVPTVKKEPKDPSAPKVFAQGCGFYKLFWLFFIGAFLGDLIETAFCRLSIGYWMSRSSLVIGTFSMVWGVGVAGATWILNNYRDRSDRFLFWFGIFFGGFFEYFCSVFTERIFGRVFWDYRHLPFNLGGRINLLFCLFWGIASVIWLKNLYPIISGLIEKIPVRLGKILTFVALGFLIFDIALSSLALSRYDERAKNIPPRTPIGVWVDQAFPNEKMKEIYPTMTTMDDKDDKPVPQGAGAEGAG
ncbi:MAG: putative ABC transporter permease [Lachnospiraceae bacterium]